MFPRLQSRVFSTQSYKILIIGILIMAMGWSAEKIATVHHMTGSANIIRQDELNPIPVIVGRSVFSGDRIQTSAESFIKLSYDDKNTSATIDEKTEVKLSETTLSRSIHVHHGSLLLQNSAGNTKKMYIFTKASQTFLKQANLWFSTNLTGEDEYHILNGKIVVFNANSKKKLTASKYKILYSFSDGTLEVFKESKEDLPQYIKDKHYVENLDKQVLDELTIEDLPLSKYDLIPIYGEQFDPNAFINEGFGLSLSLGDALLSNTNYYKVNISPRYHGENIRIALNLDGYLTHDENIDLNEYSDVYDVLDRIKYVNYISPKSSLYLHIGQLQPITFGYGQLIKRYSNQLNNPRVRNTGFYARYFDAKKLISVEIFTSSLREIQRGGGVTGLRVNSFLSSRFPLTIGLGIVSDLNQYAGLPNTSSSWNSWNNQLERPITAIEIDATYDWIKSFNMDMSIFTEFVGIWLPENHYYYQIEPNHTNDNKWREGTWGLTLPGLWVKYKNYYDFKIAFQVNSALHLPQYFGPNYELERIRYSPGYDDFNVSQAQEEMLDKYSIENKYLLLPKDIYPIIDENENDPSETAENNFPTIGLWTDVNYHFRKIIDLNFGFAFYSEVTTTERSDSYFSADINIALMDNVIKGITQLSCYASQMYTSSLFDFDNLDETIYLGAKVGVKLPYHFELILEHRELHFDSNFDGTLDNMNISLAELRISI